MQNDIGKFENIVSVSGGKDSTATLLLALERAAPNLRAVFADTGAEHPDTHQYLNYLENATGVRIERVTSDFTRQIARKRETVQTKWRNEGVPESTIETALAVLHPTGNPFLDLCIWKGRFPSRLAQFCTEELKVAPITEQVYWPALRRGHIVVCWQGIRAEESPERAKNPEWEGIEPDAQRVFAYRPILSWTACDVFALHDKYRIEPNPLYKQGMGRVGCMPCINCRKDELYNIQSRFPEVIDRLREWESVVSKAAKRGSSTFFHASGTDVDYRTHGIDQAVERSKTSRGGKQYDLLKPLDSAKQCSSIYGLCE